VWPALAVAAACRVVLEWPLPDNHIYLLAYLSRDRAGAGDDGRGAHAASDEPLADRRGVHVRDRHVAHHGGRAASGSVAMIAPAGALMTRYCTCPPYITCS